LNSPWWVIADTGPHDATAVPSHAHTSVAGTHVRSAYAVNHACMQGGTGTHTLALYRPGISAG
jgi:hypothetical protein